jgi:holo-[acyl-carrier protein] synthase
MSIQSAADRLVGQTVICVGTDLVDIDAMRATLRRQPRFAERVFTGAERAYCEILADPAERFAVRFAAKEAVLKALGVGLSGSVLTDIEVTRLGSGQPRLGLTGRAAALADTAGVTSWLLTMSHGITLAHALVAGLAVPQATTDDPPRHRPTVGTPAGTVSPRPPPRARSSGP